jgi:hypothetical protein
VIIKIQKTLNYDKIFIQSKNIIQNFFILFFKVFKVLRQACHLLIFSMLKY